MAHSTPTAEFVFQANSLRSRESKLTLSNDCVTYEGKSLKTDELTSIRYGIKPLQFDMFNTGAVYLVDLKDIHRNEINIRLKSYFFMKRKLYNELFENISDIVWEKISPKLISDKLTLLENRQSFSIGDCEVREEGIYVNKKDLIGWHECYMQKNYDRLVINSRTNSKLYAVLPYAEYWDVFILISIFEHIMDPSGIRSGVVR